MICDIRTEGISSPFTKDLRRNSTKTLPKLNVRVDLSHVIARLLGILQNWRSYHVINIRSFKVCIRIYAVNAISRLILCNLNQIGHKLQLI